MQFNAPPNWPVPPAGWSPPPGWTPDPEWGPAPEGWPLWITSERAARTPWVIAIVAAVVAVVAVVGGVVAVTAGGVGEVAGKRTSAVAEPAGPLLAPRLISPADGASFSSYPRSIPLSWSPVAGASSYSVVVQWENGDGTGDWRGEANYSYTTSATSYTTGFVGKQRGRWRVTAIAADGTPGPPSEWRIFISTV